MGKGKRKNKHTNKPQKVKGEGTQNVGGAGSISHNSERNENDILLSLEESVDWHNQTSGFVSSYALPIASSGVSSATVATSSIATETDDTGEKAIVQHHQQQIAIATIAATTTSRTTNGIWRPPTVAAPIESTSSSTEGNDGEGGDQNRGIINDIFRPPSRSPSRSPRHTRRKTPNNIAGGGSNLDLSSTGISIASDSTDAMSNLAARHLSPSPLSGGTHNNGNGKEQLGLKEKHHLPPTAPSVASAKTSVSPTSEMVGNFVNADDDEREMGISPLQISPITKYLDDNDNNQVQKEIVAANNKSSSASANKQEAKRRRRNSFDNSKGNGNGISNRRNAKKNNLVIQPIHISARSQPFNPPFRPRPSLKSTSSLPPPHPLSKVESHPPSPNGGSRKTLVRGHVHSRSSDRSWASDAESSAGGSEATPIMSPRQTCSFSSADWGKDRAVAEMSGGAKLSPPAVPPDTISTSDLKGIDICFVTSDSDDDDDDDGDDDGDNEEEDGPVERIGSASHPFFSSPQLSPNAKSSAVSADSAAQFNEFKGDSFFANGHTRQFSSDDRFFEGIHNSGLSSLSFEQVADMDLTTSMEAEIELVYNRGSFDAAGLDAADSASFNANSIDEEVHSVEERKEMEKRILQWRRGRHAMLACSPVEKEQKEEEEKENGDDFELAPLTSFFADDHKDKGNAGGSIGREPNGYIKNYSYHSSRSNWFWWRSPIISMRNYMWWWRLRPDQHYDIILKNDGRMPSKNEEKTPRQSNMAPMSSTFFTQAFNTDGAEDDDDGDESKGLTSLAPTIRSRRKSEHYDDIDFERNDRCCWFRYCCKCSSSNNNYRFDDYSQTSSATWHVRSGWKKLLAISSLFLLLAWVLSHGKLSKHHESSYQTYSNEDSLYNPLAREHFMENQGRVVDDEDDYYATKPMERPNDDDNDFHSTDFLSNREEVQEQYDSNFASRDDNPRTPSQKYNKFVGIDTIVVLGSRHAGRDWLIDRLKRLYPNMNVVGEFANTPDPEYRALRTSRNRQRGAKVIDPISTKFLSDDYSNKSNAAKHRKKSKSAHIIVIAVFLNPYDWVELMRVDPDPRFGGIPKASGGEMDWEEFIELESPSVTNRTILELRAEDIRSAMVESLERDDVKLVIPIQYEELVEPYSNYDNYVRSSDVSTALPGITGLMDRIQARTGMHPDESAGWRERSRRINPFWTDPIGCSGHVCFMSLSKMRNDAGYIQYMNENVDWDAERLIAYQKRSVPKPDVDQIVILGERHTGAEWLVDRLSRCFPTTRIQHGLGRPGRWFQSQPDKAIPNTLIISIFLNPYDWVELMRQRPINAPAHKDMEWSEFVTSPWERKRSNLDNSLSDIENAQCSFGFSFEEITPCMTQRDPVSDSFPLYELRLDSTNGPTGGVKGDPYSSLLELRADKILNFFRTAEFEGVVDFIPVRYEDLVWDEDYPEDASYLALPFPGIAGLLEKIRDQTSLIPDVGAGWITNEDGSFAADALGVGATKLDPYYVQWMQEHVDWDVEMLVGYSP